MLLDVKRQRKTVDGIMGIMTIDVEPFTCFTVENLGKSIPAGTYDVDFTWSNKFRRFMPHIIVPDRDALAPFGDAGIRIHVANFASSLEGCIGVGEIQNENAVYASRKAFDRLFRIIRNQKDLKIKVEWDTGEPV